MKIIYVFSILLFFSCLLIGQVNSDSLISTTLDSVVVNATRYSIPLSETPYSIKSIEKVSTQFPTSLKGVLQTTSGIMINNRFNLSQGDKIILRGIGTRSAFGVRGIKIFLDGIPLTFTDGQAQLNNLDLQSLEKIEIVKGPSSTLYGNSLGGAILMESSIADKNFIVQPEVILGNYGFKKYSLKSQGNIFDGNYTFGIYSTESNGFRNHSQTKFYGVNFILKNKIYDNIFLSVVSNYYNAPFLLNPSSLNKHDSYNNPTSIRNSVKTFVTGKKIEQFQNGLNLLFKINNNSKIKSTFYTITRSLQNSIPGRIIELERFSGGVRVEFENKLNLLNNDIYTLFGVDYESQLDKRKEFENGGIDNYTDFDAKNLFRDIIYQSKLIQQNESVKSLGLFSHINFKLTKDLTVFGGLRFDDYFFEVEERLSNNNKTSISMDNISEMLGFSYKLKNNITLYGNYSNGFQTPTTNELSNNPFREGGFNNTLSPELINSYELGLRSWWLTPDLQTNISIFKMDISDMLISYQNETEETYYRNAGRATNIGIEIDAELQATNNIELLTSYTYMNFKFTDYKVTENINGLTKIYQLNNNYLPGIPKHNFYLSASYNFPFDLITKLSLNWTDKYFANDFNGPLDSSDKNMNDYVNDEYSILTFELLYSFESTFAEFDIKLTVNNIFDTRYNDSIVPNAFGKNFFEPAAGRIYYLITSISF